MSVSRIAQGAGLQPVTPVTTTTRLPPLAPGDVIAVRVARHLGEGGMRLVGAGFQIDVDGQHALPLGSRALLEVSAGPSGPRLAVRPDPAGDDPAGGGAPVATGAQAAARIAGLATRLAAGQDGIAPLYAGLGALAGALPAAPAAAGGGAPALPPALAAAIQTLFGLRLDVSALDGRGLRRAAAGIAAGGLERALAGLTDALAAAAGGREAEARQATPPPLPGLARKPQGETDRPPSAALLAALAAKDGAGVAALLRAEAEAALARARFTGLAARGLVGEAPGEAARGADQVLLLPLALDGGTAVVELRLGRDDTPGHDGEGAHPAFRLRFGFASEEEGTVDGAAGLDGRRFFAHVRAEREETRARLVAALADIRREIEALGLQVMELRIGAAEPGEPGGGELGAGGAEAAAGGAAGQLVDRRS